MSVRLSVQRAVPMGPYHPHFLSHGDPQPQPTRPVQTWSLGGPRSPVLLKSGRLAIELKTFLLFQFGRAVGSPLSSSGYSNVPRQYGVPPPSLRQTMMLSSTSSQNRQWVCDIIFKNNFHSLEFLMLTRQLA